MADTHRGGTALRILVIDDEETIRVTLSLCLEADGHAVTAHGNIADALAEAGRHAFDLVFLDVRLGVENGLDFLPRLLAESPWTKIIVITAYASVETAVRAMKAGATDYLPKPFTPAQVQLVTQKVAERRALEWKIESLQNAMGRKDPEAEFPTASSAMKAALELARQVAASSANVLIWGEVGTGKGRLARAVHAWSKRGDGPLAVASCDAPDADALDAELFGSPGAAVAGPLPPRGEPPAAVAGKVALAEGGTLVLYEVGDTPPSLQPKLHRLLTEKEYERHNDFKPRKANVRVVATSGADLEEAVRQRRFRPELLLALDVVRVRIPPLRERPEDVRLLAKRYLAFFGRENHRPVAGFTPEALRALEKYPWPGNTRELRNLVERAVLLCRGDHVGIEHFPPNILNSPGAFEVGDLVPLETIEDQHIRRVLESAGTVTGAASILGVGKSTVFRWLKRFPSAGPGAGGEAPVDTAPPAQPE